MAWIESHQTLRDHPKVHDLSQLMGWDFDTAIGKLHRLWWWCVDYAEDGDLRRHNDGRIAGAVGLNGDSAKRFVEAMVTARWLDREPYFRVHDWWDYSGRWLQSKYSHYPEKWQEIKGKYVAYATHTRSSPNLTKQNRHNQPPQSHPEGHGLFDSFWAAYPKKIAKGAARKAWNKLNPNAALVEKIVSAVKAQMQTQQWVKDGGQFIPHPATWLNQSRWEDEVKTKDRPKEWPRCPKCTTYHNEAMGCL